MDHSILGRFPFAFLETQKGALFAPVWLQALGLFVGLALPLLAAGYCLFHLHRGWLRPVAASLAFSVILVFLVIAISSPLPYGPLVVLELFGAAFLECGRPGLLAAKALGGPTLNLDGPALSNLGFPLLWMIVIGQTDLIARAMPPARSWLALPSMLLLINLMTFGIATTSPGAYPATRPAEGRSSADLLKAIGPMSSPLSRRNAACALGGKEASPEAVLTLSRALWDEDLQVQTCALVSLIQFSPKSKPALAAVIGALSHPRIEVAQPAEEYLAGLPMTPQIIAGFAEAVRSGYPLTQVRLAKRLEKLGPEAATAVPILKQALADKSYGVPSAVLPALAAISPDDPEIRRLAAAGLRARDINDRVAAARAMVLTKDRALVKPGLDFLIKTLPRGNYYDGWKVKEALQDLGIVAVPALIDLLNKGTPDAQLEVVEILARMRPPPVAALPTLRALARKTSGSRDVSTSGLHIKTLLAIKEIDRADWETRTPSAGP